jgi:ComF family protein
MPQNPLQNLLDWLYPPTCIACRQIIALHDTQPRSMLLCARCQTLFSPVTAPLCHTCGVPTEKPVDRCVTCFGKERYFTTNRAAFLYDDLMRDMMHELKFRQDKQIAHSLGKLWATQAGNLTAGENTCFVPLPMHAKKQRERGFNQAEVLTRQLSDGLGIPMEHALVRTVDTPPQSGLHPRQRVENVHGAFDIAQNITVEGKVCIIVDDIYTTGASMNECARVLRKAGAVDVFGMTLSIVEKGDDDNK